MPLGEHKEQSITHISLAKKPESGVSLQWGRGSQQKVWTTYFRVPVSLSTGFIWISLFPGLPTIFSPSCFFFSTGSSPLTFHTLVTLFAENPRLQEKSLSTFSNKDYLPSIVWPQGWAEKTTGTLPSFHTLRAYWGSGIHQQTLLRKPGSGASVQRGMEELQRRLN